MSEEENNNIEINPSMGHEEGGGGLRNIYKKPIDASEVLESPSYQDLSAYLCANILNYAFGKQTINENKKMKTFEFIQWNKGGMV